MDQNFLDIKASLAELKELLIIYSGGKTTLQTYTVSEACEEMRVSRTTFDRLKKGGKISVTKVGGKQYVSQESINLYFGLKLVNKQ
jgi:excisionase family DNA binding protein